MNIYDRDPGVGAEVIMDGRNQEVGAEVIMDGRNQEVGAEVIMDGQNQEVGVGVILGGRIHTRSYRVRKVLISPSRILDKLA